VGIVLYAVILAAPFTNPLACLSKSFVIPAAMTEVVGSNPIPTTKTKLKGAMMLPFNL
jgi:hypothetical protein